MNDEELKQRIKYLVEHGGLYDDPLDEVRRWARIAAALACCALLINAVLVAITLK